LICKATLNGVNVFRRLSELERARLDLASRVEAQAAELAEKDVRFVRVTALLDEARELLAVKQK
jgi:hypothetical protein